MFLFFKDSYSKSVRFWKRMEIRRLVGKFKVLRQAGKGFSRVVLNARARDTTGRDEKMSI